MTAAEPLATPYDTARHWRVTNSTLWPTPVRSFIAKIDTSARGGWSYVSYPEGPDVFAGRGVLEQGGLSEETDGEGKRRRITRALAAESYRVVVRHQRAGIRAYALWAKPEGKGWLTQGGEVLRICMEQQCAHCCAIAPVIHALAYPRQVKLSELAALVSNTP